MLGRILFLLIFVGGLFFSPSIVFYKSILFKELSDLSHIFFFFFIFLYFKFRLLENDDRKALIYSLFSALLIEVIQPYFGRSASLVDFINGVIGGFIGFSIYNQINRKLILSSTLLLFIVFPLNQSIEAYRSYQYRKNNFPILGLFNSALELKYWKPVLASDGSSSKLKIRNGKLFISGSDLCGTEFLNESLDWSSFKSLKIIYKNLSENDSLISVRVDDTNSGSRYGERFNFEKVSKALSSDSIEIILKDLIASETHSRLDLKNIRRVVIFSKSKNKECFFSIKTVKLE